MILHLIEIALVDGTTYRFCDLPGAYIRYNNLLWQTGHGFIEVQGIGENIDRRFREYTLSYASYDPDLFQPQMLGDYHNAKIRIKRTELDNEIVGNADLPSDPRISNMEPSLLVNGLLDSDETNDAINGSVLVFTITDKMAVSTRVQGEKYTHESQRLKDKYDYGLADIAPLIDSAETWGGEQVLDVSS